MCQYYSTVSSSRQYVAIIAADDDYYHKIQVYDLPEDKPNNSDAAKVWIQEYMRPGGGVILTLTYEDFIKQFKDLRLSEAFKPKRIVEISIGTIDRLLGRKLLVRTKNGNMRKIIIDEWTTDVDDGAIVYKVGLAWYEISHFKLVAILDEEEPKEDMMDVVSWIKSETKKMLEGTQAPPTDWSNGNDLSQFIGWELRMYRNRYSGPNPIQFRKRLFDVSGCGLFIQVEVDYDSAGNSPYWLRLSDYTVLGAYGPPSENLVRYE